MQNFNNPLDIFKTWRTTLIQFNLFFNVSYQFLYFLYYLYPFFKYFEVYLRIHCTDCDLAGFNLLFSVYLF